MKIAPAEIKRFFSETQMNSFEFELWIDQYKVIIKEIGAERPLFPDEITKLDENIDYSLRCDQL